jgi:type IV pilus assembly protein PilA
MMKFVKNQKGLTLVELLAVIVILGVIAAIAVPAISNTIANSRANADQQTIHLLEDTAIRYAIERNIPTTVTQVDVDQLVANGFLREKVGSQVNTGTIYESVTVAFTAAAGWTANGVGTAAINGNQP